eukprot:TRINITY_DN29426_c0_g1_i1.p1 TRINITY_DN29426_c0_g1~~TRINITY_DN29426_c0_g1_i1.p1  ORF type:complete len:352 (-),score=60.72 TRINITY_DN29426_c0_g1_i1:218-1189(-)
MAGSEESGSLKVPLVSFLAKPPDVGQGLFMPKARDVGHALAEVEEKHPELFGPPRAIEKCGWGKYNCRFLKQFRLVKLLIVESMCPAGYLGQCLRVWLDLRRKTELIKVLQATEYVFDLAKNEDAVRLISAMHNAYGAEFKDLDVVCKTGLGEAAISTTIISLMTIYCWMLLLALRPDHPGQEHGNACRLLRSSVPPEGFSQPLSTSFEDLCDLVGSATPGPPGSFEPEWLETSSCLSLLTMMYLREIGLYDKDISWEKGGHHRTCIRTQFAFRELLCSMIAALKSDLEMATTLQAKVFGGAATLAFTAISFFVSHAMKPALS